MLALSSQTDVQNNITMALVGGSDDGVFQSTGSKLIAIFYKQYERRCLLLLARAFQRWHTEYPLQSKCDELFRQLKERNNLLENVRGSYLKDVVSIKYHLNQLSGVDPHLQIEKYKEKLFDLHHNLPSVDIRDVIEKAKKGWNDQSSQLFRDTLMDSGLIDPESAKTLNAWEQSRSFKRMMRVKRGPSYNFPNAGGESLMLAAPTNHKLFVRYCQDCIGLIALVKNWNQEVETSLKFKADYGRIDEKIEEFKKLIRSLQDIIEKKEKEVLDLMGRNKELEDAKEWFENWSKMRIAEETKNHRQEQQVILQNMMSMAEEDKVASLRNLHDMLQQQLQEALLHEQELYRQLQYERNERQIEVEARIKLGDEMRAMQLERHRMAVEMDRLNAHIRQDATEKSQLQHRLENMEKLNTELQIALGVKEKQYEEYRKHATERMNDLSDRLREVSKDLKTKEDEVDNMREDLRKQKALITKQNIEIIDLKGQLEELQAEMTTMTKIEPKKKISKFRVVAIAIMSLYRLASGLKQKNFKDLGLLGYKVMLKQQDDQIRLLSNDRHDLYNRLMELTDDYDALMRENARLLKIIEELENSQQIQNQEIDSLKLQLQDQQMLLLQMQQDKKSLEELIQSYESNDSVGKILVEKSMQRILRRAKVFVRLQRSISNELGRVFLQGRSKLQFLNLDTFMNEITKEMRAIDRLFDGTTSSTKSTGGSSFTSTKSLPMAMRKQVYLKQWRGFTDQMKYWFKVQKPMHYFSINTDYQEWMHWLLAVNVDAITGREKEGSNEYFLRLKIQNTYQEEKKKMKSLKASWSTDIKRMEEFVQQVRECFQSWKTRLNTCGELDQNYRALLEKYNILLQQKMTSDRTVVTKHSEKPNNRTKLLKMKNALTHLLESDISTYLTSVVGAIDDVHQEYGLHYSNRGSSAGSVAVSGQVSGTHSPNRGKSNSFIAMNNGGIGNSNSTSMKIGNAAQDIMTAAMDGFSPREDEGVLIGTEGLTNPFLHDNNNSSGKSNSGKGGNHSNSTKSTSRSKPKVILEGPSLHDIAENSQEELHAEESYYDIILPPLGVSSNHGSLVLSESQMKEMNDPTSNLSSQKIMTPQYDTMTSTSGKFNPSQEQSKKVSTTNTSSSSGTPVVPVGSPSKSSKSEKRSHNNNTSPKGSNRGSMKESSKNRSGPVVSSEMNHDSTSMKQGNIVNANEMDEFVNDDDDLLDPDLDGEEDESFSNELLLMKKEALMFLQHEQRLKTQIDEKKDENQVLTDLNLKLQQEVEMLRREYVNFYHEKYKLTKELSKLLHEFESVCHENGLLREMVEDGYRYFSGEKNEILEAMDYFLREKEKKRMEVLDRMKSKETQVDCVACEMLEITKQLKGSHAQKGHVHAGGGGGGGGGGTHHHGHTHGSSSSQQPHHINHHAHKFPNAQVYYEKFHQVEDRPDDSSTMAEVHQNYAKAYGQDVILVPRPRSPPPSQTQTQTQTQTQQSTTNNATNSVPTQSSIKYQAALQPGDKVIAARSKSASKKSSSKSTAAAVTTTATTGTATSAAIPPSMNESEILAEELAFKLRSFRDEYDQFIADQQQQDQQQQQTLPALTFSANENGSLLGNVNVSSNPIHNSSKSKTSSFVDHVLKAISTTETSIQVSDIIPGSTSKYIVGTNSAANTATKPSGDRSKHMSSQPSQQQQSVKIPNPLSPTFRPKSSNPTTRPSSAVNGHGHGQKSQHTKASAAFEHSLLDDSLPQFGSLDIAALDNNNNKVIQSAPQSRPLTADKRRQIPPPSLNSLSMDASPEDRDVANSMYKNQQLFQYAKTYLARPQSAMPLTTPHSTHTTGHSNKGGHEKSRPKSGSPAPTQTILAHSGSAPQVSSAGVDMNNEASKFRKIRQIPSTSIVSASGNSNSSNAQHSKSTQGIATVYSDASTTMMMNRKNISTSSPMIRKLLGGGSVSHITTAAGSLTAANIAGKKESRQISNTAAFLQQNYIRKNAAKLNGLKGSSNRFFDYETTATPLGGTMDENDNMDGFILQDHEDDDKSFS